MNVADPEDEKRQKWWQKFTMDVLTGRKSSLPMMELAEWEKYRKWMDRISYSRIMTDRDRDLAAAGWMAGRQEMREEMAAEKKENK